VSAAAMAAGVFYTSCGNDARNIEGKDAGPAAIMIGDVSVPPMQLDNQVQQMAQQFGQTSLEPRMEAMLLMNSIDQAVQGAANLIVAEKNKVDLSDAAVTKFVDQMMDKSIADARDRLITEKKLKPNATQAEFDKAFMAMPEAQGKSPADIKKLTMDQLAELLKDPDKRQAVLAQLAPQMLAEALKAKSTVDNATIKASFDNFEVKKIVFPTIGKDQATVEAQAKKVLADLKSKAITFEQAMDRYNTTPMPNGKKPSTQTDTLARGMIKSDPNLKPLELVKPGEISEVVSTPEGLTIFKVLSIQSQAPAEFEKNLAKYRDQYLSGEVNEQIEKQRTEVVKSGIVKFPLAGYAALYDLASAGKDSSLMNNESQMKAKLREIADKAKAATTDTKPEDDKAAVLAWYAAFDDLYNRTTDKAPLYKERTELLQAILNNTESFSTRMELVDLGLKTKDPLLAAQSLLEAAQHNVSYDTAGEQNFRDINAKKDALVKAKLINPDEVKQLEAIQAQWRTDKAQSDKVQREMEAAQKSQAVPPTDNKVSSSKVDMKEVDTPDKEAPGKKGGN
jgi:hypothetical protein